MTRRHETTRRASWIMAGWLLLAAAAGAAENKQVWTDPQDPTLPADYCLQGEYTGQIAGGAKLGCQVIALGQGAFQAVVYPGGLPGDGWDGEHKVLMDGRLDGQTAAFQPAAGDKQYLAQPPEQFSATRRFPPAGHKDYTASTDGQRLTGKTDEGQEFELKKIVRTSPTLGAAPPDSARVLFDGSNKDAWRGGRLDEETRLLNTDGQDMLTRDRFNNYTMHLEFLLPYRPDARGQGRGNSGFYQVDHYELQILDSFGLEGLNNECGGIYTKADPSVNMCLPPLVWQTYDVDFTNAVQDENGQKIKNAVITVKLNGVVIHDQVEINGPTGGHRNEPEGTPGRLKLQGHGNPLQFRNIWIVPKDATP